jgi:agmatine/peptidylarginine deiminase
MLNWQMDSSVASAKIRKEAPSPPHQVPRRAGGGVWSESERPWWGEFEKQSAVVLGANELLSFHPDAFVQIVKALTPSVNVICILRDQEQLDEAREILGGLGDHRNCRLVIVPADTMWIRDYGPLFVRSRGGVVLAVDPDCSLPEEGVDVQDGDNEFPSLFAQAMGVPSLKLPLRLQGGNFLNNGGGLFVTTEAMTRNNLEDGRTMEEVHRELTEFFGLSEWIVLEPLLDEPTEHADMFMVFLAENVVAVGQCDPEEDPENAARLDRAARRLSEVMTRKGPMRVYRIPMPPRFDGVWRTYTNVIFANGKLLVPTYSGAPAEMERDALDLYRNLLPGWEIVGIDCEDMIPLGGALHCVSMNLPGYVPIPQTLRDIYPARIPHEDLFAPAGPIR